MYTIKSVDGAVKYLYNVLFSIFELCIPIKKPNITNDVYPIWFNKGIIDKLKRKESLRKRYLLHKKQSDYLIFSASRSELKNEINFAKKQYMKNVQNGIKDNIKFFWDYIRSQKVNPTSPTCLNEEGVTITNPDTIANKFADYFHSVYSQVTPKLETNFPTASPWNVGDISLGLTNIQEIEACIRNLRPDKATGPDGIPPSIIIIISPNICVPLAYIFNLCIMSSTFPKSWKLTRVSPIHKADEKTDVRNYRPVAVLSTIPKIFEMIICDKISPQIAPFLRGNQHGFLPKKSTVTNLLSFSRRVAKGLDCRHQTDVIYTDFAKAFDRVDHDVLIKKMHKIGFNQPLLIFFASYLKDRSQYVNVNGYDSHKFAALSGIPQGSNLGPMLFLILIDDIQDCIHHSSCLLFADDMKLMKEIESDDDYSKLQADLDSIMIWSVENKLNFNIKKCVVMTYSRSQNPLFYQYRMNGEVLTRVNIIKDLGVIFDSRLTFSNHIVQLTSACFKILGFVIRTCKQFNNIEAMTAMFNGVVRSKLEYASIVWIPYQIKYINMIEQIQKKFLRYVYMRSNGIYPKFMHHVELLKETNYQSLETRRNAGLMVFELKLLKNLIDCPYLLSCCGLFVPDNYCRTRSHDLFYIPQGRTDVMAQHSMTRGMTLLNALPADIDVFNISIPLFKKIMYC